MLMVIAITSGGFFKECPVNDREKITGIKQGAENDDTDNG